MVHGLEQDIEEGNNHSPTQVKSKSARRRDSCSDSFFVPLPPPLPRSHNANRAVFWAQLMLNPPQKNSPVGP